MRVHELKTWPEFFADIVARKKTFEIRKDDRGFQVGDLISLKEYIPEKAIFTGREVTARIEYVLPYEKYQAGLKRTYCVFGFTALCGPIEMKTRPR